MRVNPYIAGNPISGGNGFFGRSDIFREVLQVLRHPQHNAIVLYGQRRIGKTSVLYQLEQQLATTQEFTPVYFDLQDKADKPLNQVLAELAQKIAHVVGLAAPDTALFDAEGEYFRQQFLPQAATQRELVLLFDEFDVLDSPQQNQAGQAFFPYLRQWMADIKRVHFVFVIGRRPEDLSTNTIATFKGVRATRVSRLSPENAAKVVRQSEQNGSLDWSPAAVERVWDLAQGHPYFTQLLCSVVWEQLDEAEGSPTPTTATQVVWEQLDEAEGSPAPATATQVDKAVDQVLQQGANAFYWIWEGLPPAERVVMAAMAEVPEEVITRDRLVETLNQSGVRLIVRQLEVAPDTLVEWDVLQPIQDGYRFTVPLLRQWVVKNRPLRRVKEDLDRLNPLAENLFYTGQTFYNLKRLEDAEAQLRRAIQVNPNHLKARLLLGEILFETKRVEETVKILDETYSYDTGATRADLIRALLVLAEGQDENSQLTTLKRILDIQPNQPVAKLRQKAIWGARGEVALKNEQLDTALDAFEKAEDLVKAEHIRNLKRNYEIAMYGEKAKQYETNEEWQKAINCYRYILENLSTNNLWQERLEYCIAQANLNQKYKSAIQALELGELSKSQVLLAEVISMQPNYKEADRYLLRANRDVDWLTLKKKSDELIVNLENTQQKLKEVKRSNETIINQNQLEIQDLNQKLQNLILEAQNPDRQLSTAGTIKYIYLVISFFLGVASVIFVLLYLFPYISNNPNSTPPPTIPNTSESSSPTPSHTPTSIIQPLAEGITTREIIGYLQYGGVNYKKTIPSNTKVFAILRDGNNEWAQILTENEHDLVWIRIDYVDWEEGSLLTIPTITPTVTSEPMINGVTNRSLTVWENSSPLIGINDLGTLSEGETITIIARNDIGDWLKIHDEDFPNGGWVKTQFVDIQGDIDDLSIESP